MNEPLAIIREQVAIHQGVPVADLLRAGRGIRQHHWARQVGYWVSRETTSASYREIAQAFGRAEHTTVIEGIKRVQWWREHDIAIAAHLNAIREACASLIENEAVSA